MKRAWTEQKRGGGVVGIGISFNGEGAEPTPCGRSNSKTQNPGTFLEVLLYSLASGMKQRLSLLQHAEDSQQLIPE